MMETFVYDGTVAALRILQDVVANGGKGLCPKCGADLIVALDPESVAEHHVHPGIYCSKTPKHFFEMHELRPLGENAD